MVSHSELITHSPKFESVRHANVFWLRELPKKKKNLLEINVGGNFISEHMHHK